ncbi:MAG: polyribonucleotide nucleotidyltransferase, partial [Actinobacteria bacterium]|nr:polyribonucleotide nucleotidyltransferase [Actinomycetota bacterium]
MQSIGSDEKFQDVEVNSKVIRFTTGKMAKQSNASVLVECGSNGVLITATMDEVFKKDLDFFPFVVDVEERMYAAGRIPGSFFRREGKATDKAILNSRLADRPLRPIFDKNLRNEVQVIATVLSVDQIYPYDILVMNGASCALYVSDIPFDEPVGAVRVAKVDGGWIINPSYDEIKRSIIDIIVAGTESALLMVEAKGKEADEETVIEAIEKSIPEIKKLVDAQREFRKKLNIDKKDLERFILNEQVYNSVVELAGKRMQEKLDNVLIYASKDNKYELLNTGRRGYISEEFEIINREVKEKLIEEFPDDSIAIDMSLKELERELVRKMILQKGIRPDGRRPEEIRNIECEVGLFPETTHGTGLFTRGK